MAKATSTIEEYVKENDTDVLLYLGPINRGGYAALSRILAQTPRQRNCVFVLGTYGGDAHAGYRIARALSHHYPDGAMISILVADICKSAGTLICIGAHELIIADCGELGPLDVQVRRPDEIFERSSGLDIIRGLRYLQESALESYKTYLLEINSGSGMSTRAASEVATKLAIGIHEPIFAQIDPIRLGEMQAMLTIARDYGERLNERSLNLQQDVLDQLASSYSSHDFVIDRKEARKLFKNVRQPVGYECHICNMVTQFFPRLASTPQPLVIDLAEQSVTNLDEYNLPEDYSDAAIDGEASSDSAAATSSIHATITDESQSIDGGQLADIPPDQSNTDTDQDLQDLNP